MHSSERSILLVEDNDFDVKRVMRGFRQIGRPAPISRARDGVEALQFLETLTQDETRGNQIIIMLDLNMPRMGGLELLDNIRADPSLHNTPVFVVTSSDYHSDVSSAHAKLVSGYFVKPDTIDEMVKVLRVLSDFWDRALYEH